MIIDKPPLSPSDSDGEAEHSTTSPAKQLWTAPSKDGQLSVQPNDVRVAQSTSSSPYHLVPGASQHSGPSNVPHGVANASPMPVGSRNLQRTVYFLNARVSSECF